MSSAPAAEGRNEAVARHRSAVLKLRGGPAAAPMAGARAALSGRFLISHHIAKTAGTTLSQILLRNIAATDMVPLPWALERVSAMGTWHPDDVAAGVHAQSAGELARRWYIGGHLPGITAALLPRPGRVVTMLRDPAERAISNFYAVARRGIVEDMAADVSLEDYLQQAAPHYWFSDTMLRSLSGDPRLDPFDLPLTARVTPDREPADADVEAVIRRLSADCALVGLAEAFDEFLLFLAGLMGWSLCDIVYTDQNMRDKALQPDSESPATKAAVLRWNRADSRLYAAAEGLQPGYRADYGPSLGTDLALFDRLNRAHRDGAAPADLRAIERAGLRAG